LEGLAGTGILRPALSWFGNLRSTAPGSLSTFPGLVVLLAVLKFRFPALLPVRGQSDPGARAGTRPERTINVNTGTTVFAFSARFLG
jgi:hypothetical protein